RQLALRDGAAAATADAALRSERDQRLRELDAEREFLRRCNVGGEAMKPEDQERVRDIGTRHHWRNVSGVMVDFLTAEEIENLTIRAGTLTQNERDIINYHIVATIKMLEALPWPRHLTNVPEYAGGHHERMDGKGYPKGLTREQMSVQARCMGIADIFEALTARDRPYKPGMKLSQALSILGNFRNNGHIDPDLFALFVKSGVYRDYAIRFMAPEYVDEVDEASLLGAPPAGATA
ncbi:MAG: phosphohydrolase, partial [Proteobacteria bacterium]|nr:phosphohydrolase [Pseudomonadota bacterium]